MSSTFRETLIQNAVNETGYYHLELEDVTDEQKKTLNNNRDIKQNFCIYENGYAKLDGCKNEDKPYLKVFSMEKSTFENLKFNLLEGNFPQNENEVIISQHIIQNGKVDLKIGDKINIEVGKRKGIDDVLGLGSKNPYQEDKEELIDTIKKDFTIVRNNRKTSV